MMPAVRLTTDRLVLRVPEERDYAIVSDFMGSSRARFVGGPVDDAFALWRGFLGSIGHWTLRGYGFFMVDHDGQPVGRVGVINHVMWDEPELGWHLFDGCEGHGYATEAAVAVRRWAHEAHGLGPLVSYIVAENAASRRVAERLGARREGTTMLLGTQVDVWRHPEPTARGTA